MTQELTFAGLAEQLDNRGHIEVRSDRLTTQDVAVWRRLMARAIRGRGLRFRSHVGAQRIIFELPDRPEPDDVERADEMTYVARVMDSKLTGEAIDADAQARAALRILYATIPSDESDVPAATRGPLADEERAHETVISGARQEHAFINPANDDEIVVADPTSKVLPRWTLPNFAKLYAGDDMGMSPRTALALWMTAGPMADYAREDLAEIGDKPATRQSDGGYGIFTMLPPMSWGHAGIFRERIIRCFDDLSDDIAKAIRLEPRSTAEEIVLHLIIRHASQVYMDEIGNGYMASVIALLPEHEDDYDFVGLYDEFFQDVDYEFLWEADGEMLGIDDPEHPVNAAMRIGDKRVQAWFVPFDNVTPRDPGRGFNRPRS